MKHGARLQFMLSLVLSFGVVCDASADEAVSIAAPSSVHGGARVPVTWTGPAKKYDKIGVFAAGAPDNQRPFSFEHVHGTNPRRVEVPEQPGKYEFRYLQEKSGAVLARANITVTRATATLQAPATAVAGASVPVTWTGPNNYSDKIGLFAAGAADTQKPLDSEYLHNTSPRRVKVPEKPGKYEFRYLTGQSGSVLARATITVTGANATVTAPTTAVGGASVPVTWTGPNNEHDKIGLFVTGAADTQKPLDHEYLHNTSPRRVKVPEKPGKYEFRYLTGQSGSVLARATITVTGANATVTAPATAVGGASVPVTWTGPNNEYDKIGLFAAGAADTQKPLDHEYLHNTSPRRVKVPEKPGKYEFRYLAGQSGSVLAKANITVTKATATIAGPVTAVAGTRFEVVWKGPANQYDHIVVATSESQESNWEVSGYVRKGQPLSLRAPLTPGEYELRYLTGQSHTTLARAKLQVTPAKQQPGLIRVSAAAGGAVGSSAVGGSAVEVILDASGSMLKRIGSRRRIDIAAQTLKKLTSATIPSGTRFALRVFGGDSGSCQTDLELPLQPLNPAAVAAKVDSLKPKSLARTPIAASLEAVAKDMASVKGERLVILVTDGEETCGGDPARAIGKLRQGGVNVRVNIVGFAIDDAKLAATFRLWSDAGNGTYFDARDAAGLDKALTMALTPEFEILDGHKKVVASGVVGGEPVQAMPGTYSVRLKGGSGGTRSITVRARQTAQVRF